MSIETLEYDLAAERVRVGQFEVELADANEQLIESESQLAAARARIDQLEAEWQSAVDGENRLRSRIAALEAERDEARRTIKLFGSWLDRWSLQASRTPSDVYAAWDEVRDRAAAPREDRTLSKLIDHDNLAL